MITETPPNRNLPHTSTDLVPGFGAVEDNTDAQVKMGLCSLYLLFGMALLAMSINLVQEVVIESAKSLARKVGIMTEESDDEI